MADIIYFSYVHMKFNADDDFFSFLSLFERILKDETNVAITLHSQTIRKPFAWCDCPGNEKYYVITITCVIVFNSIYSQPIKC